MRLVAEYTMSDSANVLSIPLSAAIAHSILSRILSHFLSVLSILSILNLFSLHSLSTFSLLSLSILSVLSVYSLQLLPFKIPSVLRTPTLRMLSAGSDTEDITELGQCQRNCLFVSYCFEASLCFVSQCEYNSVIIITSLCVSFSLAWVSLFHLSFSSFLVSLFFCNVIHERQQQYQSLTINANNNVMTRSDTMIHAVFHMENTVVIRLFPGV